MNQIKINLENCFGIKKIDQTLNFAGKNVVLIYAPNGLMKTSFAKTLQLYSQGKPDKVKDVVADIPGIIDIKDGNNNIISSASIYVSNCEESDTETSKNITAFLADSQLKQQYENILTTLSEKKRALFKEITDFAISSDSIKEFETTFCDGKPSLFYSKFEEIMADVTYTETCYNFRYNTIFDKGGRVKDFIETNREELKNYSDKYQEILQSSKFFKQNNGKTFGTYQASELSKSVADNAFFEVNHKIVLGDGQTTLDSADSLANLISDELSNVLSDPSVKKAFDKIDKKASSNQILQKFKEIIENSPDLVEKLLDYDNFHRDVWKGYFVKFCDKADDLLNTYQQEKPNLDSVLQQAAEQIDTWERTINTFKRRFSVPFDVRIKNQTDLLLNQNAAALSFEYKTQTGPREIETQLLEEIVLSKGELRAFYTLQLLFAIEKMKIGGAQEYILVFDDISDSYDYKNKYAMVEYLYDIKEDPRFKMIILTHNFDFYRTVHSRLQVKRESTYMAYKDANEEIKFHEAEYVKDPFAYIKNNANIPEYFIALIPLVRNLIEYSKDISNGQPKADYLDLTACFHVKIRTEKLTINDIKAILQRNIDVDDLPDNNTLSNIKDYIYGVAEDLNNKPCLDEIHIQNKLVFAIAIRLRAEEYMIAKLKQVMSEEEFTSFYTKIVRNQTAVLIKKFNELCPVSNDIQMLIKEVNLITPENIHLNSFMFEPLVDMSVWQLKKLYEEVNRNLIL